MPLVIESAAGGPGISSHPANAPPSPDARERVATPLASEHSSPPQPKVTGTREGMARALSLLDRFVPLTGNWKPEYCPELDAREGCSTWGAPGTAQMVAEVVDLRQSMPDPVRAIRYGVKEFVRLDTSRNWHVRCSLRHA
jgi:hypothetical protein